MQTLRVSADRRHIEQADGGRFYFLGDTAWELFHKLNREEAAWYLRIRAEQGYNMIQAVVLAELDGLGTANAYGRFPLKKTDGGFDLTKPDTDGEYSYFDHVEYIVSLAEELGLYIGMLPTWGDKWNRIWGIGPEIFTPENARIYGEWLAKRFAHHVNLLWILGGDRPVSTEGHRAVLDALAEGLQAGDGGKFLKTLHPSGASSSSAYVHDAAWLDFNMMQSGHGFPSPACFDMMAADYARVPTKPVMDGEPCYEDHPINFKTENDYYDAYNVRLAAYRNLFSGACGNTYGHHAVWQFRREDETDDYCPCPWTAALHRPGAEKLHIYRDFIRDNDLTAFRPVYDAVTPNPHDTNYVAAMVSDTAAYLYIPAGAPVHLNREAIGFTPKQIVTFSPEDGTYSEQTAKLLPDGKLYFPGRAAGRYMDIVVILKT